MIYRLSDFIRRILLVGGPGWHVLLARALSTFGFWWSVHSVCCLCWRSAHLISHSVGQRERVEFVQDVVSLAGELVSVCHNSRHRLQCKKGSTDATICTPGIYIRVLIVSSHP